MKVEAECAGCTISRATGILEEATSNPAVRFRIMTELLRLLSREFRPTAVPADLGTKRDRLIKRISGNNDPYRRIKQKSNEQAMKLLPYARKFIEEGYTQEHRFKRACLCAVVGNAIEFNIPSHRFAFKGLRRLFRDAEKDLVIDDTSRIYELTKSIERTLYLTDNAGEIVFDVLLAEQIKNMGLRVAVAVKDKPIVNDATMEDAHTSGLDKVADNIVTTGTDAVGFSPSDFSQEFLDIYNSSDMVFAKGMGYAETLTESRLEKPHILLFRTKCEPVAHHFGVSKARNVVKLMPP